VGSGQRENGNVTTEIVDGEQYEGARYMRITAEQRDFAGVDFTDCLFDHCVFTECAFARCSFTDCRFVHCDLSIASFVGTRFTDVRFASCKLIGIDWAKAGDSRLSKLSLAVGFDNCLLNYGSFFGLALRRVRLAGCIAREADFRDADLTEAVCTGTDFTGSKFLHTNLTKANFTGATGYAINPTANVVTKARFSLPEAISLLSGFDVVIE